MGANGTSNHLEVQWQGTCRSNNLYGIYCGNVYAFGGDVAVSEHEYLTRCEIGEPLASYGVVGIAVDVCGWYPCGVVFVCIPLGQFDVDGEYEAPCTIGELLVRGYQITVKD
jgi:hypothetical protein